MADDPQRVLVVAGTAVDEAQLGRELDLDEGAELKIVAPIEPGSNLDLIAGEADPLLSVEDALASFEADRIVLVAGAADESAWSQPDLAEQIRDNTGLPVRELRP